MKATFISLFAYFSSSILIGQNPYHDLTFGNQGVVITSITDQYDFGNVVALQADNKILVGGESGTVSSDDMILARYHPNGELDLDFGDNGSILIELNDASMIKAIAIQSDEKIVATGSTWNSGFNGFVARFLSDGTLDSTFGNAGIVQLEIESGSELEALEIQPDGNIILGGKVLVQSAVYDFLLVRLMTDGNYDQSFGVGGVVQLIMSDNLTYNSEIRDIKLQPDGKIVCAGLSNVYQGDHFAISRHLSNGELDLTFSGDGKAIFPFPGYVNSVEELVVLEDGKLVIAGRSDSFDNGSDPALLKLLPNGTADPSFGTNGKAIIDVPQTFFTSAIIVQFDGKYILSGGDYNFSLIRVNVDGTLDSTFYDGLHSDEGMVMTDFQNVSNAWISDIIMQPDGKIIATGYAQPDLAIVRYLTGDDTGINTHTYTKGNFTLIFPNPVESELAIFFKENYKSLNNIILYNSMGTRIYEYGDQSTTAENMIYRLDLPLNINPGIYLIQYNAGSEMKSLKFIKSRY